jgi:CRP-like cAMP-binding protein
MNEFDLAQPQSKSAGSPQPVRTPTPPSAPPPSASFKSANSQFYDAKVADQFFRELGKSEKFAAGTTLFLEGDKSREQGLFGKRVIHRMNYLADGEVALTASSRLLDAVKTGEVIGEMSVIREQPGSEVATVRSATVTAKTAVTGYSPDGTEVQAGLARPNSP